MNKKGENKEEKHSKKRKQIKITLFFVIIDVQRAPVHFYAHSHSIPSMKVFVFSDYHAQHEYDEHIVQQARASDAVVCAGDCSWMGHDLDNILSWFDSWNKPVYLIHGNHESEKELVLASKKYKNIHCVHTKQLIIGSTQFLFWGGGGFSQHDPLLLEHYTKWKPHIKHPCVIVSHAPPFQTRLDNLGRHVGNVTLRFVIDQLQPAFALSGHIHETEYFQDTIGRTTVINVGRKGVILEL
jgi:uncharacterized protein